MSKVSTGLVSAVASIMMLGSLGLCHGDVPLQQPVVRVEEGDRLVDLFWYDPDPASLVAVHQPVLGSIQFPWKGNATLASRGNYSGACDWIYDVQVFAILDTIRFSWNQVTDWKRQRTTARRVSITETDRFYNLSDSIQVMVLSDGLFIPDLADWTGPTPTFHGLYSGMGVASGDTIDFTFTCTVGGELASGGSTVTFEWTNDIGGSGSFVVDAAGQAVNIAKNFKVAFATGTYTAGDMFSVGLRVPFASGDRFSIKLETFDGYLVLRHSVEDRAAASGDTIAYYKVIANISKCDTFELFSFPDGTPDPGGDREYRDKGIMNAQPGVSPDPEVRTVLNGFPYDYAVVTYDRNDAHRMVMSNIEWKHVVPSAGPASSADNVYVVPNPYVGRAGWETGGVAKIQFINVPNGAKIRIYDAAGGFIKTVYPNRYSYDSTKPQGAADWNLKDDDGKDVVSGVYIYRIESNSGAETGRFIIVR